MKLASLDIEHKKTIKVSFFMAVCWIEHVGSPLLLLYNVIQTSTRWFEKTPYARGKACDETFLMDVYRDFPPSTCCGKRKKMTKASLDFSSSKSVAFKSCVCASERNIVKTLAPEKYIQHQKTERRSIWGEWIWSHGGIREKTRATRKCNV